MQKGIMKPKTLGRDTHRLNKFNKGQGRAGRRREGKGDEKGNSREEDRRERREVRRQPAHIRTCTLYM